MFKSLYTAFYINQSIKLSIFFFNLQPYSISFLSLRKTCIGLLIFNNTIGGILGYGFMGLKTH
jgi:hypothetical protein